VRAPQKFKLKGNYSEGFGLEKPTAKWTHTDESTEVSQSTPADKQKNSIDTFVLSLSLSPCYRIAMALVQQDDFQHILRVLNTNIDGKQKIVFALTAIKGVGRRFANVVCKKADVDLNKRAGELSNDEVEQIVRIIQHPRQFKIPDWFLNRKKDIKDGKYIQAYSNILDQKLREDFERLKRMRCHRGLRHAWGLRVRGQHTKTTGRKGRTIGVSKKRENR